MDFAAALVARRLFDENGRDQNGIDPNNLNYNTTNGTLIAMQRKYCKLNTECPESWWVIDYRPNIGGNVIYLVLFLVILAAQLWFGIRKKTWTFLAAMVLGLLLESIGYLGRVLLWVNPFIQNYFLIYLICLTIGPAFFTACIYLCLGRIITAIGSENSRLQPKLYTWIFVGFDFLALVLQGAGGGIASTAKDRKGSKKGTDVMVAGLVSQVISMVFFMVLWADFNLRVRRNRMSGALARTQPPLYAHLRTTKKFRWMQYSLWIATVLIFIRSIYRCAELAEGFSGKIANDEASFMILEGPMIIIAVGLMTIFHPAIVFGDLWVPAGLGTRSAKLDSPSTVELSEGEDWKSGGMHSHTAYRQV